MSALADLIARLRVLVDELAQHVPGTTPVPDPDPAPDPRAALV